MEVVSHLSRDNISKFEFAMRYAAQRENYLRDAAQSSTLTGTMRSFAGLPAPDGSMETWYHPSTA
jgi:hypothetical protein